MTTQAVKKTPVTAAIEPKGSTIVLHFGEQITLADCDYVHDYLAKRLADGGRFALVADNLKVKDCPKECRKAFAQFEIDHKEEVKASYRGIAIVFSNPLAAAIATTINFFAPPSFPKKVFKTLPEAEAWLSTVP